MVAAARGGVLSFASFLFRREPGSTVVVDSLGITVPAWLLGVVANGLLFAASFWIARFGFRQARGLAAFLGTGVLFWALCTIGLETLSAFGAISPGPMLAWALMWLALAGIVRWFRAGDDLGVAADAVSPNFSAESIAGLALILSAALILGMRSLLLAVKVVSDGPIYHLYFAARWWKAGRLLLVAAPFGENAATYFPANGDLWFTWLMASWGGDRLAKVGQAPFLLLAAIAAFGCARLLGASRPASLVATCWFASSTPLLLYSFEPNVDTIFVAGYMMATYFFLQGLHGKGNTSEFCLGAMAAGLSLGTKSVGVVFIPPLLVVPIALVLFRRRPVRSKITQTLVVLVALLVTGGYWYVCNALLTGNPVYPLEVRFLGRTVFHGWYGREAMRQSPFYLDFASWRALGDILFAVLDPRLVPLWLASLAGAWAIKNPKTRGTRGPIVVFSLMAIVNVALYWAFIPYRSQQRFMLQALGLAVVPLAVTLDRRRWLCFLAAVLLGTHLLTPECWPFTGSDGSIPWDLSPSVPNAVGAPIPLFSRIANVLRGDRTAGSLLGPVLLGAILVASGLLAWTLSRVPFRSADAGRRAAMVLAAAVLFLGLGYLDVWCEPFSARVVSYPPFADFYIGWQRVEAGSGPMGSRVAYAGTNIPYYLLGKGLRNEVRYVNIDGHRDWLLHDYHREALADGRGSWPNPRPGWDRIRPDYQAWLDNLVAEGAQLLVVTRVNPAEGSHNVADREGFPIERAWADAHPERFEPIYGRVESDPWFRLYRLRAR